LTRFEISEKVPRDAIPSLLPKQQFIIFKAFLDSCFHGSDRKVGFPKISIFVDRR